MKVNVIGAGLAGCEAAYQLAKRGIEVNLYEMKKYKKSPAHKLDTFAELVCSNSLRSNQITNAVGLMKEELRRLDSLIIKIADKTKVPAGGSLAVDRDSFSKEITDIIKNNPLINIIDEEVINIPEGYTIIATGPLTTDKLSDEIKKIIGVDYMHFFDAAAPIVTFESIDMNKAYFKSRYDKGDADYINCPFTKEEFDVWYKEVINAPKVELHDFEYKVFEGCMPFEEMARRGEKTLLFGPMKPVGLRHGDIRPYAVCQLRQDNYAASLYNIVGFQTNLTFPAQKKIIRMIPGLEKAEIVRYGVMHRNSFICAPLVINEYYQVKNKPNLFIAGQLSGVEGYVESTASGLVAAINMARLINDLPLLKVPNTTAIGSQASYIANASPSEFQPMNANFGIFPPLIDVKKSDRKMAYVERSLKDLEVFIENEKSGNDW